jgi:aerobic C4-dicarboxylate transport protein
MTLLRQLWLQVLIATALGIALGLFDPGLGAQMKPLGDGFIALIRMLIAPVIFCTVVHGIAQVGELRRAGRVVIKALIYFEAVTTLALVFALVAVDLVRPGAGMHVKAAALDAHSIASYVAQAKHQTAPDFLLSLIPDSLLGALTQPNVLQVLLVSVLFGCALSATGERGAPITDLIGRLGEVVFRIVGFVMWVAPLGAFGAIAFTVGKFGAGSLAALGALIGEFFAVSALFVVVVFGAVAWLARVSLIRLIAYLRDEVVIVAATTSTETVLPRLMQKLRAAGCDEEVVGLVVPAGYAFNLDGTCLYLVTAAMFLAQATGVQLSLAQQLGLIAVLLISSKGAAGVAGAAFIVLAGTLAAVGTIPVVSIALILGVHRLLAEALTFVNLIGNALATLVVCRWEGALDEAATNERLGRRPLFARA